MLDGPADEPGALARPRLFGREVPVPEPALRFARAAARVQQRLLLRAFWWLALTPYALAVRALGGDPLGLRDPDAGSWRPRGRAGRYEDPY